MTIRTYWAGVTLKFGDMKDKMSQKRKKVPVFAICMEP
jgi:hypothetical protein